MAFQKKRTHPVTWWARTSPWVVQSSARKRAVYWSNKRRIVGVVLQKKTGEHKTWYPPLTHLLEETKKERVWIRGGGNKKPDGLTEHTFLEEEWIRGEGRRVCLPTTNYHVSLLFLHFCSCVLWRANLGKTILQDLDFEQVFREWRNRKA